jgi:hypothetical protein
VREGNIGGNHLSKTLRQPDGATTQSTSQLKATLKPDRRDPASGERGYELVYWYFTGFEEFRVPLRDEGRSVGLFEGGRSARIDLLQVLKHGFDPLEHSGEQIIRYSHIYFARRPIEGPQRVVIHIASLRAIFVRM